MDLRQQYLSARRPVIATVDVPAWGKIKLRAITQDELETCKGDDPVDAAYRGVMILVSDDDGNRVFKDDDLATLKAMCPLATVKAINDAATLAIGVTPEKVEQAKND